MSEDADDVFYLVNPQTRKSTGIRVSRDQLPNFIESGPFQNVTRDKPDDDPQGAD